MARISLRTVRDLMEVLRNKPLKEILLGKKVYLGPEESKLLSKIKNDPSWFAAIGGRSGAFIKLDLLHKGALS